MLISQIAKVRCGKVAIRVKLSRSRTLEKVEQESATGSLQQRGRVLKHMPKMQESFRSKGHWNK